MAENWSWESPITAPSTSSPSPLRSSPLQSESSGHEQGTISMRTLEIPQLPVEIPRARRTEAASSSRPLTLVETLQTCLTSLPPTAAPTTPPGGSLSDPSSGAPPPTLRQSRSSGALTSKPAMKRRSRASRRVPTTVVEATSDDFRDTVHRLTGIAMATPVPVRPQPQRAGPVTFIRPIPQIQSVRVPAPSIPAPSIPAPSIPSSPPPSSLLLGAPPLHSAFWQQLQRMGGASSSAEVLPQFDSFIKSEALDRTLLPGIGTSQATTSQFGSTMPQTQTTSETASLQTWWDAAAHEQAQSYLNPTTTTTTTGPFDGSSSGLGQILQDDQDLSIDAWFHQDHSGSDYMH